MAKLKLLKQLLNDANRWDLIRIVFKDGEERVGYYRVNSIVYGKGKNYAHVSLVPSTNEIGINPHNMHFEIFFPEGLKNVQGYEILRRAKSQ